MIDRYSTPEMAAVWADNDTFLDLTDMQVIITDDPIVIVDRTGA